MGASNLKLILISSIWEKKKDYQKLAGLWLAGEMVNRIGIYGSKVAEGLSAFQRRSCILTHWRWVTHMCISKLTIILSDNGLSPGRHQAIIWTNAGILLIWTLGTNFSEVLIEIRNSSFKKNEFENVFCEMSVILSQPQCIEEIKVMLKYMHYA